MGVIPGRVVGLRGHVYLHQICMQVLSDLSRAPAGDSVSAFLPAPHPPFVSILETLKQRDGWLLCWLSLQGPFFCVRIILTNH